LNISSKIAYSKNQLFYFTCQGVQVEGLRINQDKLRQGYPQELKKRVLFLLKNGVDKNELINVTKISSPTLSTWISQYEDEDEEVDLPVPKELKITADHSDIKVKDPLLNKIIDKYCAKINVNNGMSIELTEEGLILSLNTLCDAV
jgi:hypothetical protein